MRRCFVGARHARDAGDVSGPDRRRSRREPEGAPVDGIAWRHSARGIARMARSYGSPAVCLNRPVDALHAHANRQKDLK